MLSASHSDPASQLPPGHGGTACPTPAHTSNPSVQRDEENSQRKRGQRGTEIIQKVRKPAVKFKKAVIRMNLER